MTLIFLKTQAEIKKLFLLVFCFLIILPIPDLSAGSYYQLPARSGCKIIPPDQPPVGWLQQWTTARDLAGKSRPEEAVGHYLALLKEKENFTQPRWELTRLLISLQQYDKAARHLEILLKIDPDDPGYLNALGFVMEQKGHADRALELFQKAHELDHENIQALRGICQVMSATGQDRDSIPFQEKLSLLASDDIDVHRRLAEIYYKHGFLKKARPLAASLAAEPDSSINDQRLAAHIYDSLGLANISARYWKKIIAVYPDDLEGREQLARFSHKKKRFKEELEHLRVLQKNEPDNHDLMLRLGRVYLSMGQFTQAMQCMTNVISYAPDNKEALRAIVKIQTALGNEDETLASIEHYLAVEKHPSLNSLKHAAGLYDAVGRYAEAVRLYRRLLVMKPGDGEIIASLARDLQALGADSAALDMWRELLKITPEARGIYLAMITPLERLDRDDELIVTLEQLRRLGVNEPEIGLKLSLLYLKQGRYKQGKALFAEFSGLDSSNSYILKLQGKILEKLNFPAKALASYEQALCLSPSDRDCRLNCLRLAGILGLVNKVNNNIAAIKAVSWIMDWRVRLVIANARRNCGEDYQALQVYQTILDEEGRWNRECARETLLALAELYIGQERFFEAEQSLRQALLLRDNQVAVYQKLIELSLLSNDLDRGWEWLDELDDFSAGANLTETEKYNIDILEIRLLIMDYKYKQALKKGRAMLSHPGSAKQQGHRRLLGTIIISELGLGNHEEAMRDCLRMRSQYAEELLPLVLQEKIESESGAEKEKKRIAGQALLLAKQDFGLLLQLACLYDEYGLYDSMLHVSALALKKMPGSLRATILLGRARTKSNHLPDALQLYAENIAKYPDNSRLQLRIIRLYFLSGAYRKGINLCEKLLADEPQRADIIILKARILWAEQHWNDSLELYRQYLSRNIEDDFLKKCRAQGLNFKFPQPEKNFWQFINISQASRPDNLATVMDVSFVADPANDKINHVAVPLYAEYRLKNNFYLELAARKSIQRREYFQAVKEFENLCRKNPADQNLFFDLAGIYSRLGRLGDEALIYEKIKNENFTYPGLAKAAERNHLKLQPISSLTWRYEKKEGWNSYQAMEQQATTASFRYSPFIRHQVDFAATMISYRSTVNSNKLSANRFLLSYQAGLFDWLDVSVGVGEEGLKDGYADTGLLKLAVEGKLGDKINSHLAYSRDVVTDTTASLSRNVIAEKFSGGIALDIFPRLLTGGDCRYIKYSDNNELDGYNFWISSIIFTEPTYLEFTYSYDFQDAEEGKKPGYPQLDDGFSSADHPYWAPGDYWYNRFRIYFKHLLSGDTLERGTPTYYTAEYAIDYDGIGHIIHNIKGALFVEITPHIILESRAEIVSSDEIHNREFFISAVYRW